MSIQKLTIRQRKERLSVYIEDADLVTSYFTPKRLEEIGHLITQILTTRQAKLREAA